jgi:hypothetical protein
MEGGSSREDSKQYLELHRHMKGAFEQSPNVSARRDGEEEEWCSSNCGKGWSGIA